MECLLIAALTALALDIEAAVNGFIRALNLVVQLNSGMWKRKLEAVKFCGSESTLKKEAGSGSKNIFCFHFPD